MAKAPLSVNSICGSGSGSGSAGSSGATVSAATESATIWMAVLSDSAVVLDVVSVEDWLQEVIVKPINSSIVGRAKFFIVGGV